MWNYYKFPEFESKVQDKAIYDEREMVAGALW